MVLEGLACYALPGSFMSGTQAHKETSQDWLGLRRDPPGRQQHMWTAFTQRPTPEVPLTLSQSCWTDKNAINFTVFVLFSLVMGIYFDTNISADAKPHAYFIYKCTQTLQSLLYTSKQHIPSTPKHEAHKSAMHDCAWELLLENSALSRHLPSQK